jgi:hypothetical protein
VPSIGLSKRGVSFMNALDAARVMLKKASADQRLVEAVIGDETISDDIIGFHCQQAVDSQSGTGGG